MLVVTMVMNATGYAMFRSNEETYAAAGGSSKHLSRSAITKAAIEKLRK